MAAALLVAAAIAGALFAGCGSGGDARESDRAIAAAKVVYAHAVKRGENLDRGPCIAEHLPGLDDWVVDIAHDPCQPVDDLPVNQCARYRAGEAHHFVELTPGGQLIRTG